MNTCRCNGVLHFDGRRYVLILALSLSLSFDFGPQVFRFFTMTERRRESGPFCPPFYDRFLCGMHVDGPADPIRWDCRAAVPLADCHLRICNELPPSLPPCLPASLASLHAIRSKGSVGERERGAHMRARHARHGFINLPSFPLLSPHSIHRNVNTLSLLMF